MRIHFTYNKSSWDDGILPGSMCDLINGPVQAELDARGVPYTTGREPLDGQLNVYCSARGVFRHQPEVETSVLISHGIADKGIRWSKHKQFDHVIFPGPLHAATARDRGATPEQTPILGYPKLDPLYAGTVPALSRDGRIRVLYAPTQGGGGEERHWDDTTAPNIAAARRTSWWHRDKILKLLEPDVFDVVECPHPRYTPGHRATFEQYVNADVVIADGGSTIWEAMCLGIPVVLPAWVTSRGHAGGHTLEAKLYREGTTRVAVRPAQLPKLLTDAAVHGPLPTETAMSLDVLPPDLRGNSGKAHAEFLTGLLEKTGATRS